MANLSQQGIVQAIGRVVANGTTPPNGYLLGTPVLNVTRTGAGLYRINLSEQLSPQENHIDITIENTALFSAVCDWTHALDANTPYILVSTFNATPAAADVNFSFVISRVRTQGATG